MSFTEQRLSEGICTNHEFSDSKRRLKRPRDERDSSQHGDHDKKPNPQVDALEHLSSGKVFFFTLPLPTLTPSIHNYCGAKRVITLAKRLISQRNVAIF